MLRAASASKPTAVYTLAQSAIAVSCPSDTTEDVLATITIPGGTMGPNGRLRIDALFSITNSANNKTVRVRFGGIGGNGYQTVVLTTSNTYRAFFTIANRGAANSQVGPANGYGGVGSAGTATSVSAIDTTADTTLVITGQKALNTETITLEGYSVEMMP